MTSLNGVEILLVEDNPNDAELTIRALKKHDLTNHLHWVKDGAEALDFILATNAYAERTTPHPLKLILLDLKLPKVDGLELLGKIKSNDQVKNTPVVILTSSKEERDMAESYKLGVNSYVVKPVEFESFMKAVAELGFYWLLINKAIE